MGGSYNELELIHTVAREMPTDTESTKPALRSALRSDVVASSIAVTILRSSSSAIDEPSPSAARELEAALVLGARRFRSRSSRSWSLSEAGRGVLVLETGGLRLALVVCGVDPVGGTDDAEERRARFASQPDRKRVSIP